MEIHRPTPGDPTVRLSITIPKSVADALTKEAEKLNTSRSMLIASKLRGAAK